MLEELPGMADWKDRFRRELAATSSTADACRAAGLCLKTVRKYTTPGSTLYDEEFDMACREVHELKVSGVQDTLFWGLNGAVEDQDYKTVTRTCLEILERLDRSQWSRQPVEVVHSGRVDHVHEHHLAAQKDSAGRMLAGIAALFSRPELQAAVGDGAITLDTKDFRAIESGTQQVQSQGSHQDRDRADSRSVS
jgi:hypothetical protein